MKRVLWPGAWLYGGVAQLGERLLCKQEVIGSIPFTSTILVAPLAAPFWGGKLWRISVLSAIPWVRG